MGRKKIKTNIDMIEEFTALSREICERMKIPCAFSGALNRFERTIVKQLAQTIIDIAVDENKYIDDPYNIK